MIQLRASRHLVWLAVFVAAGATRAYSQGTAAAPSAADALLNAVPTVPGQTATEPVEALPASAASTVTEPTVVVVLDNPFVQQLYSLVQAEPQASFESKAWFHKIFTKQFAAAAHQWTVVRPLLPPSLDVPAQITWAYLLSQLPVPQTFADAWLELAVRPEIRSHRLMVALSSVVGAGFESAVWENGVTLSSDQAGRAQEHLKGDGSPLARTLYALSFLRKGLSAAPIARALPAAHPLKLPLAETAALAAAKAGDLATAGRILKVDIEPTLQRVGSPERWSRHYLEVARLLYQAGVLDAAEQYYLKIPEKASEYLASREELTWVWLRKGDQAKLRGNLETLSGRTSKAFGDVFSPEIPLVRAVSNLKLCYYDRVEADFRDFLARNSAWASRIDAALKTQDPPAPPMGDAYIDFADRRVRMLDRESRQLAQLYDESLGAALPAVGKQLHWDKLQKVANQRLEDSRKAKASESHRQWTNAKAILSEAIKKMQFVKVELLSQVRQLAEADSIEGREELTTTQAAPARISRTAAIGATADQQTFPFDGVIWPDEMFRLRSVAQSRCMQAIQANASRGNSR